MVIVDLYRNNIHNGLKSVEVSHQLSFTARSNPISTFGQSPTKGLIN